MTAPVDFLEQQEEEAWQKEDAYYEKLATNQTFFDQEMKDPVIESAEKYHPQPQSVKPSVAAQGWLSHRLRENLSGPSYDAARDAYANEYFGKAVTTDEEFWKKIGEDYKLKQERRGAELELHNKVLKKSFEDTLKGEPTNIAKIFSPWHEKNYELLDKNANYLSAAMQTARQAQADLEKFRPQAALVWDIMQKTGGNPSDEDINKMSSALADLSYEDRQTLYRYAQTVSQMAEPDKPQNPLSVIARQNWKSLERSGSQIYSSLFKPLIQGTMPLDEIERAAIKIRDNLIAKGGSPEEIAVQQKRIDQVAVARELKNLGQNGIDPIKPVLPDTGWLSWGASVAEKGSYMISGSAPYIALSVLGGPGLILGGAAIADYEYERIRTQNKDINPDAAHAIADVSGAAQTFLMKLRADALLARTPGVARLMAAILPKVGTHGASRFLGQAAGSFIQGIGATEAQMAVSSFLPAVVAAFREDMPDADFGQIFGELVDVQPEIFFMNAPLALIGGGVGSWHDFKNPQAIINPKTLGYRGFSEKQSAKILNAPEAVIDAVIREETPKRTQANIKAGIKQLEGDIATAKAHNAAPETPTVEYAPKPDGTDFWHVKDPDGQTILSTENIDTAIAAVTDFHQQKMVGEENVAQRGKAEGAFRIMEEPVTAQEAVIRGQAQPEPERLQAFIEQQQQMGFRDLDTMLEKIEKLPPEQREVAVAKARDLLADIELRTNKLQQLSIAKKEADIGKLQRALEKATLAGRPDMIASLRAKMEEAVTRQTPGEAAKAMQQEIVSNIGKLEAIIGILPREARGLIGGYETLAGMRTPKERLEFLQKRIAKVGQVFEKHLRTFYGDKIADILKPPKQTPVAKSKIGVKAQREVDAIRTISELDAQQTAERMAAIEEEARREGDDAPTPERMSGMRMEWDYLNRWGDLENRTASELSQNYNELKEIAARGREATKIIEEARRADMLGKIEEVKAGTEAPTDEQLNTWDMLSQGEQWSELAKGIQFSHKNFLQILSKILPENTSFLRQWNDAIRHADLGTIDKVIEVQQQMQAYIYPTLLNMSLGERYTAQKGLRAKIKGKIHIVSGRKTEKVRLEKIKSEQLVEGIIEKGKYSDADLETMREALAALPADTRKEFITFERVVSEGKRITTPLTKEKMIQAILAWGDSNVRGHMQETGYTEESIRDMHAVLEGDELAQALLNFGREFYANDYGQWNPTYREQFHMDMPKHEGYAPGRYYNSKGTDASIGLSPFGGPIETTGVLPGGIKSRVAHSARYRPTDFTQTLWEHVYQRAHWTSFAKINRELRGVLGNKDIQERLHAKLGPKGLKAINTWLDVLANAGNQKAVEVAFMNDLVERIIGGKVISALSGSIKVILNQTDSGTRFTYAMTGPEIAATLPLNPAQHVPMIWRSPTIQRRIVGGANPAVRHFFQRSQTNPSMMVDAGKAGLVPMQGYDAWLTAHSAAVVYTFELQKALETGMSQKQAHLEAMDRMDEAVYRYSQPMGVANKSLMEVSGNRYFKLWMLFQSDAALKSRLITEAYGDMGQAMRAGDKAKASRAGQRIAAIYAGHFLSTMVMAAYRDILTDEPSENIWSPLGIIAGTMLGPFTGYFLVGTVASGAIAKLSGTPLHDQSPNPLDQWWSHAGYVFSHFEDLFGNEDDGDKVISAWNHLTQATAIFGPASALPAVGMKIIKTIHGATKEEKEPRKKD